MALLCQHSLCAIRMAPFFRLIYRAKLAYLVNSTQMEARAMDLSQMLKSCPARTIRPRRLSTGHLPCAKFNGVLKPLSQSCLPRRFATANSVMDFQQRAEFEKELEMNLGHSGAQCSRVRHQYLQQRNRCPSLQQHQDGHPQVRDPAA